MTTTRFDSIRLKAICVALVAVYPALAEAGIAGRVQFVAGDVRLVDAGGKQSPLRKGQDVNEGDTLLSGTNGTAQLKMIDGAIVALRPGTELKVIDYVFNDAEDGKESASFSLVKGGLRAITGAIGRTNKEKVKIATPTATIGIRGTDHEPVVVLPAPAGVPLAAEPGTYDKVNVGATTLTTQVGTTVVAANQVGFAASPTQQPVILPKLPDFYRATPAPKQAQQQGKEQKQEQKEQKQEQKEEQKQASATSSEKTAVADTPAGEVTENVTAATLAAATNNLTAVDASGNTLDLASQTLTTNDGQLLNLNKEVIGNVPQTPIIIPHTQVFAAYPGNDTSNTGQTFAYPAVYTFGGPSDAIARDAAGNITGITRSAGSFVEYRSNLTQSESTMTDLGKHAAADLSWGRWQGGQVTQSTQHFDMDDSGKWGFGAENSAGDFVIGNSNTTISSLGSGSLHWISGSVAVPEHLARVLTGSADYTLVGGTKPTDQHGNVGTLNSASLGVNFTNQIAKANVNFTIAGNNWNMQSGEMLLRGPHFSSYNFCDDACGPSSSNITLTKNGASITSTPNPTSNWAFGSMNGSLLGSGLNGAALQYAIQEGVVTKTVDSVTGNTLTSFSNNVLQGVAGFSGPVQDVNSPFRAVGIADGWNNAIEFMDEDTSGLYRGSIEGDENAVGRVVDGPSGLIEFVGKARDFTPLTTTALSDIEIPATIKIGSAANRDVGSATIAGITVNWGRWEGGNVDIYSRDGAVKLGTIDNSGRSIHWLTSSVLTSATALTALPLTGTATYTIAGHTNPTDFKGNVGTLNSATLTADFSNAKVNAGINVSFNSPTNTSNWTMTANNMPIRGKDGFEAGTALNGINGITHTTTCSGASCGTQNIGHIDGVFFGGGQGAVVTYGMATGSPAQTASGTAFTLVNGVNGVAVMKR